MSRQIWVDHPCSLFIIWMINNHVAELGEDPALVFSCGSVPALLVFCRFFTGRFRSHMSTLWEVVQLKLGNAVSESPEHGPGSCGESWPGDRASRGRELQLYRARASLPHWEFPLCKISSHENVYLYVFCNHEHFVPVNVNFVMPIIDRIERGKGRK